MSQITLTLDLTPETLEILNLLTTASTEKTTKKTTTKDKKPTVSKKASAETEDGAPAITFTDVRAVALKLSNAGKQNLLKEIFAKYGAEKLSDIAAENYISLMADLEVANE